jgi:hypothetical protein
MLRFFAWVERDTKYGFGYTIGRALFAGVAAVVVGRLILTLTVGARQAVAYPGIALVDGAALLCLVLLGWTYWRSHLEAGAAGPLVVSLLVSLTGLGIVVEAFAGLSTMLWRGGRRMVAVHEELNAEQERSCRGDRVSTGGVDVYEELEQIKARALKLHTLTGIDVLDLVDKARSEAYQRLRIRRRGHPPPSCRRRRDTGRPVTRELKPPAQAPTVSLHRRCLAPTRRHSVH